MNSLPPAADVQAGPLEGTGIKEFHHALVPHRAGGGRGGSGLSHRPPGGRGRKPAAGIVPGTLLVSSVLPGLPEKPLVLLRHL